MMWIFKSLFSYWILRCSINLKYFLEVPEKRNEIYILNPKKAYNICELYFVFALSDLVVILLNVCMCWKVFLYVLYPFFLTAILLGHLRLSVDDMKQALYEMDEDILTPELLKQLVAFAPSKSEVWKPFVIEKSQMSFIEYWNIFIYKL